MRLEIEVETLEEMYDLMCGEPEEDEEEQEIECAGCPYNRKLAEEISVVEKFEPALYKAVNNIFKDSYEYTKKYREFYNEKEQKNKQMDGQISLFDYEEE